MSAPTAQRKLSTSQGVWLVTEREVMARVRSKAFLISTLITFLVILGGSIWLGTTLSKNAEPEPTPVAVTSELASSLSGHPMLEIHEVADQAAGETLLRDEEVDAIIVPGNPPSGLKVIGLSSPPNDVAQMLSTTPEIELLDDETGWDPQRYIIATVFGMLFVMACMTFGTAVATTVIEEKQTRVVEILLASVPARTLLAGKVLGNTILALLQVGVFIAAASVGLLVTGQGALLQSLAPSLGWFSVFFIVGFILVAAIFAAGASLVSRQEDAGAVYTPAMIIVFAAAYGPMFLNGNPLAMKIMSFVPFTAPVAMPVRLFDGGVAWWEPVLSLIIMLVVTAIIIVLGGKIYQNSLLRMGGRVKLKEALAGN